MEKLKTYVRVILWCGGCLLAVNFLFPPPLGKAYNTSIVVTDKGGQWLSAYTIDQGRWRLKAELGEIDTRFIDQLLAIEDKRFYRHSGIDPLAIVRAMRSWRQAGYAVSGASTITMQLVRKLEPRPRTLGSKIIESFRAVQIEMRLSKREILQLYLTHTPYGGNIEGVRAASRIYFDKSPAQLNDAEIALLIALPQAPEARRPDRNPVAAKVSRDKILKKIYQVGLLTRTQYVEAMDVKISNVRHPLPNQAWLTGNTIRKKIPQKRSKQRTHIISSIDQSIQSQALRLTKEYTIDKNFNTAVLIVENKTMKVRAHIGSAGRDRPGGWIDMTARPRSPGSTLKPFIYGFAFDDGLSAPSSFILDAPTRFGTYQPENFNRRYHGRVRIHEALSHSLNVPAVMALDKVGTDRFEAALSLSGSTISKPKQMSGETGLALALGGVGMRVEDLAVLYTTLANGGKARPLIWLEHDKRKPKHYQLMQETSARKITDILRQAPTPNGRVPHWLTKNSHGIAYKTGTSYGFRDAWAAGYTKDWTVIVWTGRPDGAPRVGQTGRIAAAPLLFDIFANLPNKAQKNSHYQKIADAPRGLQEFAGTKTDRPEIIFPPNGAEIAVSTFGNEGRGLSFAARSNQSAALNWFVDGKQIDVQDSSGKAIWKPQSKGFYKISVVDNHGATSHARIRVLSFE